MLAINVACSRCKAVQQFEQFPTGGQSLECAKCGAPLNSCTGWIGPATAVRRPTAKRPDCHRAWQPMDRVRVLAALAVGLPALLLSGVALTAFLLRTDDSSVRELPAVVNPLVITVAASAPDAAQPHAQPALPVQVPEPVKRAPIEVDPPAPPQPPPAMPAAPEPKAKPSAPKLPIAALAPAPVQPLTPEQKRINDAIDRGVKFLKTSQYNNGRWDVGAWPVGYAALPGLTLLECGAPASNPAVQRASKFVRSRASTLTATYELALAILFLDRLGEARDRDLIQTFAMRLVAGQNAAGGWTYQCPVLAKADQQRLLAFLQRHQTQPLMDPVRAAAEKATPLDKGVAASTGDLARANAPGDSPPAKLVPPVETGDAPAPDKKKKAPPRPAKSEPLPAHLKGLAVVRMKEEIPRQGGIRINGQGRGLRGSASGDNSNTQFAMLALWVARRHGVPMERTLTLLDHRFQSSHNADGGWGYHVDGAASASKASMTCVGLLGLAIGHGFAREMAAALKNSGEVPVPPGGQQDPAIQRGIKKLGEYVDAPERARLVGASVDLYTLWSIERVGVLYDLKIIGNKDWYAWASRLLVNNQNANGSWWGRGYHGSSPTIDTCLALLILKRTNLVQDLSDGLRMLGITEPERGSRITNGQ